MRALLVLFISMSLANPNLVAYRKTLDQSLESKKVANAFYDQFKTVKISDEPVMIGFKAMSEFMLCKHLINPMSRLSHFNKGRELLEGAIKRDKMSAELLFFRLTTQSIVPSLLNYSDNIQEDKASLINFLKHTEGVKDKDLINRIRAYLLINKYTTASEKALIKSL
jgi:hypothetical protein